MVTPAPKAELQLPANPNCVSFAADAGSVLGGRSWAELQRLATRVARPFHRASELSVLVGLGWRVALDRRNRRHAQATVYFVFDGPATAQHLDVLDETMEHEQLGFGAGSIERVPANGVGVVMLDEGRPYLVLDHAGEGSLPWFRRLVFEEGHVRPVRVVLASASDGERARELDVAIGIPAPYGDEEREVERMRLAFARHFSVRIVEADGIVREDEQAFMDSVFPLELIERLGLTDPAVQHEYLTAAREALAGRIGHHDKLGLIGLFFSACYSDGSLDAREMRILKEAGDWLGLSREDVVKYLRRFW